MFYLINETLTPCEAEELRNAVSPYVAVVSAEEFEQYRDLFDMGIDIEPELTAQHHVTKAQVDYDSLVGSIAVPIREKAKTEYRSVAFALDEKGIVFISADSLASEIIESVRKSKKWRYPSLERFIYDFLETIVSGDLVLLERYEKTMDSFEELILRGKLENVMETMSGIRGKLQDLKVNYEQLIDLGQELQENENNFFAPGNLRFFRLFTDRVERLLRMVDSLRDHANQVRDMYQAELDAMQNKKMDYLTIVATIFMPLTLITGWFGMNFVHMPELSKPWAYPAVFAACVTIVITEIIFFKRRKWF